MKFHISVICCVETTGSLLSATTLRCPKRHFSCYCESGSSHLRRVFGWTALQQPPLSAFCWTGLDALPASCLNRNDAGTMGHLIDFFFFPSSNRKKTEPPQRNSLPPERLSPPPPDPHQLSPEFIFCCLEASRLSDRLLDLWQLWFASPRVLLEGGSEARAVSRPGPSQRSENVCLLSV